MKRISKKISIRERGITLVALVITIIILLILAGVTLNTALSDNGLFARAKEATEKYKDSESQEDESIKSLEKELDGIWKDKETQANAPKLTNGMIPIKYVSSNNGAGESSSNGHWEICEKNDPEWYSYTEDKKEWANVMLSDCGNKADRSKYTISDVGTEVPEADLGSMFVWIPRYAYNIEEGYHTNTNTPKLEIQWLAGKTNYYVDGEGKTHTVKKHTDKDSENTKPVNQFIVHPAFTDGKDNEYADGEWKAEVEGIWVSKFEAGIGTEINDDSTAVSSNTVENSNEIEYSKVDVVYDSNGNTTGNHQYYLPMFKGRQFAYNFVNESQCYNLSRALDDHGNPYGLNDNANSHLMKNSEWGAVSYLAISRYGANEPNTDNICKNDVAIVESNQVNASPVKNPNDPNATWKITAVTGYSSINKIHEGVANVISYTKNSRLEDNYNNSYAWNVVDNGSNAGNGTKASTTGNITGIYDMNGCLGSCTASWVKYDEAKCSYVKNFGNAFTNGGESTYLATAYPANIDASRYDFNSSYNMFERIHGDAVYEISNSCGINNAWFNVTLSGDETDNEVFLVRGGTWESSGVNGLCGLDDGPGIAHMYDGFFSILIVEETI